MKYFHGDNGAGVGASHQTGWTALVAKLLPQSGDQEDRCQLPLRRNSPSKGDGYGSVVQRSRGLEEGPLPTATVAQDGRLMVADGHPIVCPACGGANRSDAVFCDH
jgi:hypothetical protein